MATVEVQVVEQEVVFSSRTVFTVMHEVVKNLQLRLRISRWWPVKTGNSRRGFLVKLTRRGKLTATIDIGNHEHYAPFVEFARNSPHRGVLRRNIEQELNQAGKDALRDLKEGRISARS